MIGCDAHVIRRHALRLCLLSLAALAACQSSTQPGRVSDLPARAQQGAKQSGAPARDLSIDESAGGHTLRKHVGRTDDELRDRLRHERNISAASTWTDRETAELAVGAALAQNRDKIDRWLNRAGGHSNLVVDYDGDPSRPVGRSLRRDADQAEPCSHATIVLKWAGSNEYYVLTSYPECRP